jgi:hypothetical protein
MYHFDARKLMKTSCQVIETLRPTVGENESGSNRGPNREPLVFFYCNRNDAPRREPTVILQAILRQLCVWFPTALPTLMVKMYDVRSNDGHPSGSLDFDECKDLIMLLLNEYPQTTIVIDAMDESNPEERWRLLEALKMFISSSISLVKIFIASRDDGDLKLELEGVPNLYIHANDSADDIEAFIKREVDECIKKRRLLRGEVDDTLKCKIVSTLTSDAHGM